MLKNVRKKNTTMNIRIQLWIKYAFGSPSESTFLSFIPIVSTTRSRFVIYIWYFSEVASALTVNIFSGSQDGDQTFLRGNEKYVRPCGWNRVALRVLQKYSDGDSWLGTGTDAWPVSYQGKTMDGSIILAHDGRPNDEPRFLDACAASVVRVETRGRGVYSTPDIKMAENSCKTFTSKVDGKRYKVVLQNRINPKNRKECNRKDVWLVYIPEGHNDVQTRAIVQESIRPYGLLLMQAWAQDPEDKNMFRHISTKKNPLIFSHFCLGGYK